LARAGRLETAIFDQILLGEMSDTDPDQHIAAKLMAGGDRSLATIQRYATAAERSYYKAHTELLRSRQVRNEAKTVEDLDAAVIGRIINTPPPRRNEPNPVTRHPQLNENLALRL
jgi:hypothetical protein